MAIIILGRAGIAVVVSSGVCIIVWISLQWPLVQCNEWCGLGGSETIIALDGFIGGGVVEEIGGAYWAANTATTAIIIFQVVCSILIVGRIQRPTDDSIVSLELISTWWRWRRSNAVFLC